jgi:hypothetical protein
MIMETFAEVLAQLLRSASWQYPLSPDTIPQVAAAIASKLSSRRRELDAERPVSSNGPLFRRDDSLWLCAARW